MSNANANYVEDKEGFHKKGKSVVKGNAGYFSKPIPPMRDKLGRPMKNYDEIDMAKWIEEVNEKDGKKTIATCACCYFFSDCPVRLVSGDCEVAMTTPVYDQILEELQVELDELERKIFDALTANPDGLTRRELIFVIYGVRFLPFEDLGSSKYDRKIRLAIASMQERLVPIVSSSGKAGYKLDASKETAEKMAIEMESRAAKLREKARRIRMFHSIPIPVELPERVEEPKQLSLI